MHTLYCAFCNTRFLSGSLEKALNLLDEHLTREHPQEISMGREARAKRTVKELCDREMEARHVGWFVRWCIAHPRTCYVTITILAPIYIVGGQLSNWTRERSILRELF